MMRVSPRGLIQLVCEEGVVPYPYLDSKGIWSYGIGHTAGAGAPSPAKMAKGVATTLTAVVQLFRQDLVKYENEVNRALKVKVSQTEFDAIVMWHYNTGAVATASWIKLLNAGDRAGAAKGIMAWNKPAEILGRRARERNLFRDGVYSTDTKALVYTADSRGELGKAVSTDVAYLLSTFSDPAPAAPQPVPAPIPDPKPTDISVPAPAPVALGWWARFLASFRGASL